MRGWLLTARREKGMTQLEVAKKLGISEAYYAYIERGERQQNMDISLAANLSVIFDIPLNRIVALEAQPESADEITQEETNSG